MKPSESSNYQREEEDMKQSEQKVLSVNGGDGNNSYNKNSLYQRQATNVVKDKLNEAIMEKFDVQKLCSASNIIRIADMGCATGPNTFIAMQNLVHVMKQKYMSRLCLGGDDTIPEFQVFFNDHVSNDFNMLFGSLPKDAPYFAAVAPGSFHDRLFPKSSLHLVYSSIALHWLSRVPEEVADSRSKAWNEGRVHYTSASTEVTQAYKAQFADDVGRFLEARAVELVAGGMVVIIMPGIPDEMPHRRVPAGLMYHLMALSFMDMVKDGLINEDQLDSFNLPLYTPTPEEMTELVTRNGSFDIETIELTNPSPWINAPIDIVQWIKHVRAAMEGMLMPYFEPGIIDELFSRLVQKLLDCSEELESSYRDKIQLLVVLKRK